MKSNDFFVVKRSSKLYKFYNFLGHMPGYSIFTPKAPERRSEDDYKSQTAIFRDICTFLRVNLFYLLITPIVLSFLSLVATIFVAAPIVTFVNIFYTFNSVVFQTLLIPGTMILVCYLIFPLIWIFSKWGVEVKQKLTFNREDSNAQPNIFIQAIKDKHNQICRSIKLED